MNGFHAIIELVVVLVVVVFVAKLILRRAGRPVTKVYNTITPAVYLPAPMPPQYPPVPHVTDSPSRQMHGSVPEEIPVPDDEPMTEDELFDDIVRRNYRESST